MTKYDDYRIIKTWKGGAKMDIIKSLIDLITSIASLAASIIALIVIRDEKGKK